MPYKIISILLGFLILAGCGGSQSLKKEQFATPYSFIEPQKTEIYEESEKGGSKNSILEDEMFTPHPFIPLDEVSNNGRSSLSNNLLYEGPMYDLGVEIQPKDNKKINPHTLYVYDPMLESIRQDLIIKWGIDEPVIQGNNGKAKTIADIETKISIFENSMKGDLAALRSENLMLVSRLQDLEKQFNTGNVRVKKTNKKEPAKRTNKPSQKTKLTQKQKPASSKLSYKVRYDSALANYRLRKFESAIKKFKALTDEDNSHSLSDNAQYWIGECYYHLKFYNKAASAFEKVLSFDVSNKKDSAILMKGKALKHLGLKKDAIEQFRTLIAQYPRSSYTKRARELISNLEKG